MITKEFWRRYVNKLSAIDKRAGDLMQSWINEHGLEDEQALINYAYGLTTKYGEASATLSCEMYDYMADMSGAGVPDAVPAETATYREVARGTMWGKYHSPSQIPSVVSRQVRQAGADTMIQNAKRDHAEWAWVPQGDTCSFCITLASRGWQDASETVLRGNHAEHIHQHCDCTFAIAFNEEDRKQYDLIYDPKEYEDLYYSAEGDTPDEKIKYIRRPIDHKNREKEREKDKNPSLNTGKKIRHLLNNRLAFAKTGSLTQEEYLDKQRKNQWEREHGIFYDEITTTWYEGMEKKKYDFESCKSNSVTVKGETYTVDGHFVKLKVSPNEKRVAKLLLEKIGGDIKHLPKVEFPKNIKTADFLFNGQYYDLKTKGFVEGENPLQNDIQKKKGQAKNFIFDLTGCNLDDTRVVKCVGTIYRSPYTKFVDEIVIIRGENVTHVYKRK